MIPPFDKNNVLPPYIGATPTKRGFQSPYTSDIMELCHYFAKTPARICILKGFVRFRIDCAANGIGKGVQWLDGSFMEDIELSGSRDPRDIDVISLIQSKNPKEEAEIIARFPSFCDSNLSKAKYHVDHYFFYYDMSPRDTIESTKYWIQLFSHNRLGIWKGMIEIPLYDNTDMDIQALNYLNSLRP